MPEHDMSRREEQSRREAPTEREGETNRAQEGSRTNDRSTSRGQAQDQARDERRDQATDEQRGQAKDERRDRAQEQGRKRGDSADRAQVSALSRERDAEELKRRWPEMSETAERDLKQEFSALLERADEAHRALDAAGKRLGPERNAALDEAHETVDQRVQGGRRDAVEVREAHRSQDESRAAEASERLGQRKDEIATIAQQAVEEARRAEQEPSANDLVNRALAEEEQENGRRQQADVGRSEAPSRLAAQEEAGREEARRRLDSEGRLQAVERYNRARMEQEEATRNLMDYEPISVRRQRVGELAAAEPPRPAALEAELSKIEALDRKTRELARDQRSTAPGELLKAQEEKDARLAELESRDLDRESRAYVDWTRQTIEAKASLMNTGKDLDEVQSAKEKADAAVLRTQDALAEVSRTVNDLLRSGPRYQKLSRTAGPDEVMAPQEWEQQRDQWRERGREIALQVDHLVAVAEVARSREMNRFLEVYERSSLDNRLRLENELVAAFDRRENLVRMVDEVNRKKSDQGWGSLTTEQVSPFYKDSHLQEMRDREDRMRVKLAKEIGEIAESYEKLRRG